MATRTYEIKGKYTDGTDYTAGTFTVSDGTNGTNGTNGKGAITYLLTIETEQPVKGAQKTLLLENFSSQELEFNDTFFSVCKYDTDKSYIGIWAVQSVVESNVDCVLISFIITTGATGSPGKNGTDGKNGKDGVGFYYTTDTTTGTTPISTLLSQIMPSGIKVNDFLVNAQGKVCQVTSIQGNTVSTGYRTSIKGATGAAGSPGATGKGIASVQVVEV